MLSRKHTNAVWPVEIATPELGWSTAMQRVYELAAGMAHGESPVLLLGEPGSGKRRLAQWIHDLRRGTAAPFVQVTWGELSELFVEQRLFGCLDGRNGRAPERGSGLLESAVGGTLYVQEIGRFSLATQAKLARVVSEGSFEIPGTHQAVPVEVRVILSSTLDLDGLLERAALHHDLYDGVARCAIDVPALRARKEDILPLAYHAVRKYAAQYHKSVRHISSQACAVLISYDWPGNLVELDHVIERAVVGCRGNSIDSGDLPRTLGGDLEETASPEQKTLDTTLDNIERALIVDALKAARGNQAKAAQLLGITERMMGLRVKKHGLAPRRFRTSA